MEIFSESTQISFFCRKVATSSGDLFKQTIIFVDFKGAKGGHAARVCLPAGPGLLARLRHHGSLPVEDIGQAWYGNCFSFDKKKTVHRSEVIEQS